MLCIAYLPTSVHYFNNVSDAFANVLLSFLLFCFLFMLSDHVALCVV